MDRRSAEEPGRRRNGFGTLASTRGRGNGSTVTAEDGVEPPPGLLLAKAEC